MIRWLLVGCLALCSCAALALSSGSYPLTPAELGQALCGADRNSPAFAVVWELRMPRLLLGILVGAALACAGSAFQALLRSPLADPFLIGTSAGASLGTALAVVLGLNGALHPVLAFAGALGSVALVSRLARSQGVLWLEDFLLAGVMVSTLLGSLVSLLLSLAGRDMARLVYFLLGNLGESGWDRLAGALLPSLLGLLLLAWNAYPLNLLSLGEDLAASSGVSIEPVKRQVLLGATLLTGAAVSAAGLIGFVGLVIPQLCRLWVGPDLRKLLPLSLVWGAVLLSGCDLLARSLPQELPVGVVTALVGAPWFLWQLRRSRAC